MKHAYVQLQSYSGIDWHDAHNERHQLLVKNRPEIEDARTLIIDSICSQYPLADRQKVEYAYDHPESESYQAPVSVHCSNGKGEKWEQKLTTPVIIGYHDGECFCTKLDDQYTDHTYYEVSQIEESDVRYLLVHSYVYGLKYGNTTERFYEKPFATHEEALEAKEKWINSCDWDVESDALVHQSDFIEIVVFDVNDFKHERISTWYQNNLKAIALMEELGETPFSESFHISATDHLNELSEMKASKDNNNFILR